MFFNYEVYFIDCLDKLNWEKMCYLCCLCFVRLDLDFIGFFIDELREFKYGEYYFFFSNIVKKFILECLVEVDDYEVVKFV